MTKSHLLVLFAIFSSSIMGMVLYIPWWYIFLVSGLCALYLVFSFLMQLSEVRHKWSANRSSISFLLFILIGNLGLLGLIFADGTSDLLYFLIFSAFIVLNVIFEIMLKFKN